MINVAKTKSELQAMRGDRIAVDKTEMVELLDEVEIGQNAQRALKKLKSLMAIAASSSGAPA